MPDRLVEQSTQDRDAPVTVLPRMGVALLLLAVAYLVGRGLAWGPDEVLRRGRLAASHRQFLRQPTIARCVAVAREPGYGYGTRNDSSEPREIRNPG